ncbi:ABC transporter substrate-binding protein [Breznakia pachnodae]|uniref:Peptide/nickel transport system substrate-binding protein n=1 Tax=Breznakia pachnodae TaxID=265178 RepID=A0ABU0E3B0_9FIRM|nr:ABC transporter substrate-binding protein [Breznakia pachnodae]MDQ0361372.1 peptide/nickel transport system substrate-binding protein [Breznakia pachnodae]
MKKVLTMFTCLLMAMSLVACDSSESSDTLIMGAEKLTGTFSPLYYSSSYDGYVVDLVYDKLLDYDENNELRPELAKELPEFTNEGKTITFKLQEGIKFSNGEEFTANDVAFTYRLLADPDYDGRYQPYVQYIEGYEAYKASGKVEDFTGINVIDDYTIEFTFTEARSDNVLNVGNSGIVSESAYPDYKFGDMSSVKDQNKTPIGTGPYVLSSWDASSGAVFAKNEEYWGEGFSIEKIIIKPVEMTTDWDELKDGSVDLLAGMIEPKKVGPASATDNIELSSYPRSGMGYIEMNSVTGATQDVAVRKALVYAFDRQGFVDSYYECDDCKGIDGVGAYVPGTYQNPASAMGEVVRNNEEVEGLDTWEYDIEKAKATLDEAGWVVGDDGIRVKDGQRLEIKVLSMKDHDILSNLVPMWQKDWKEIGAEVSVATVDFNTLLDKVYNEESLNEWNVFFMATSWTNDDMGGIYSSFHSTQAYSGGDNTSRINDPELDGLLDEAMKTVDDQDKAIELYHDVAVRLGELCVKVPVYGNTYFDLYDGDKIEGLKTNTLYPWTSAIQNASLK